MNDTDFVVLCISCNGKGVIETGWDQDSDAPLERECWVCRGSGEWPSFESHPAEIAALVQEA